MDKKDFTREYFNKRKKELYNEIQGYVGQIMPLLSGTLLANTDFLDDFVAAVNELLDVLERGFSNGYISEGSYGFITQSLKNMKENLVPLKKNYNPKDYTYDRNKRELIKGFVNDSVKYYNRLSKYF